jgi:hypothetical protein
LTFKVKIISKILRGFISIEENDGKIWNQAQYSTTAENPHYSLEADESPLWLIQRPPRGTPALASLSWPLSRATGQFINASKLCLKIRW